MEVKDWLLLSQLVLQRLRACSELLDLILQSELHIILTHLLTRSRQTVLKSSVRHLGKADLDGDRFLQTSNLILRISHLLLRLYQQQQQVQWSKRKIGGQGTVCGLGTLLTRFGLCMTLYMIIGPVHLLPEVKCQCNVMYYSLFEICHWKL